MRVLSIVFLWTAIAVYADIIPLTTWCEIDRYLHTATDKTLVVLDIDLVLIQPRNPLFQAKNAKSHWNIVHNILQNLPLEKKELFWQLLTSQQDHILLDKHIPHIIASLQQACIPTMALTNTLTGEIPGVICIECKKIRTLNQLGIDFSCSAPSSKSYVFSQFPSFRENYPNYFQGILFTNGKSATKGDALIAFIKTLENPPEEVLFIDDLMSNLTSVEEALDHADFQIKYTGLLFLGAECYPSPPVSAEDFQQAWEKIAQQTLLTD